MASHSSPQNVIVVGGGIAGTTCAAELSAQSNPLQLRVTLIDPQPFIKHSKVIKQITRTAFDVSVSEDDAYEWSYKIGIHFVKDKAVSIAHGKVICAGGRSFPYDALCIATGARPYLPPALRKAEFAERVLTLRDIDSVQTLRSKLLTARRVLVVGGGGIALELVHEISNCDVVWVMKGGHVGSAFFDERGAEVAIRLFDLGHHYEKSCTESFQSEGREGLKQFETLHDKDESTDIGSGVGPEWMSQRGQPLLVDKEGNTTAVVKKDFTLQGNKLSSEKSLKVLQNCEITSLKKDKHGKWPIITSLSDGKQLGCDLILAGTGVIPNTEWLRNSGIQLEVGDTNNMTPDEGSGIVVSAENMCTNMRGVFAAGDCTMVQPETAGENWFQMRLWTQARASGRACAQSMAMFLRGEDAECAGLDFDVFAHATHFFGRKVVLLGRYNAQGLEKGFEMLESGGEMSDGYYVRAVLQNGRVKGALLIGDVDTAETFENLILDGLDVGHLGADLVDPRIDIEDYFD